VTQAAAKRQSAIPAEASMNRKIRVSGGKAVIHRNGEPGGFAVRQFKVYEPEHYQVGPSPCVWIHMLQKGYRTWDQICVNPGSTFYTIEQDGKVLYDSRDGGANQ
jgi:hypothetical protein